MKRPLTFIEAVVIDATWWPDMGDVARGLARNANRNDAEEAFASYLAAAFREKYSAEGPFVTAVIHLALQRVNWHRAARTLLDRFASADRRVPSPSAN